MDSGHNAINSGNAQEVYSSGGDIVLAPSGGAKKKRWPIVVAVLLFLIAIGAGVGAWIMSQPQGGGNGGSSGGSGTSSNSLREKFNNYANYVLFGKDDVGDFDYSLISETMPYFMSEGLNIDYYVGVAQDKYDNLAKVYNGIYDLSNLELYFQYYAAIQHIDISDLIDIYRNNGFDDATMIIRNNYRVSGLNQDLDEYLNVAREISLKYLVIIKDVDVSGCLGDNVDLVECYDFAGDDNYMDLHNRYISLSNRLYSVAIDTMEAIYKEIYEE